MGIKIIDDFIQENGTPEQIKAYQEYSKKLDNAPARVSFIITSAEVAKTLTNALDNDK